MEPGIKVWLEKDSQHIIGGGRYKLLKTIREEGSLKKAAEKLGYSYRYAWGNIKKIEERLGERLIISHKGGSHGGDSKLTEHAERLLELFEEYQKAMKELSVTVYERIFKDDKL